LKIRKFVLSFSHAVGLPQTSSRVAEPFHGGDGLALAILGPEPLPIDQGIRPSQFAVHQLGPGLRQDQVIVFLLEKPVGSGLDGDHRNRSNDERQRDRLISAISPGSVGSS
jgi:hypothetical protein